MPAAVEDRPVPRPFYVLRGHTSEIQVLQFHHAPEESVFSGKEVLVSGDAEGYVIIWSLLTLRPLAIWKAHTKAILSVDIWDTKFVTHGRDNKLYMWEVLRLEDMNTTLPLPPKHSTDLAIAKQYPVPFMLCALDVNSINFCQAAFFNNKLNDRLELLVAVPGLLGSEYIDIYTLPSTYRVATRIVAKAPAKGKLGNVMAVDLQYPLLAVGYENGAAALFRIELDHVDRASQKQNGIWSCLRQWSAHREAVLSITLNLEKSEMYTCGIDSRLVRYDISLDRTSLTVDDHQIIETRHAGQQSMRLRSDHKLLLTAGWDAYARVYTTRKLKQVAVLSYHKLTIQAVAFREKMQDDEPGMLALGSKDTMISLWKIF